jgi:DNA-binding NarL/FixJ family response regulator
LMQGDVEAANASIRRIAGEVRSACDRARVLDAYVEIVLTVNDVSAARAATDELSKIAEQLDAAYVYAISERATGAVSLAEGDARSALGMLRQSLNRWRELEAPYEAAKVQALIGLCCRELGDRDTADLELVAAQSAFAKLGAAPDVARVDTFLGKQKETSLTDREIEILKLIASGMTNRQIGGKLEISEKTVARHVSNIFMKLDLNSRAAATAYAYQHGLA